MARKASKDPKMTVEADALLRAVDFVMCAQSDKSDAMPYQTHAILRNKTIMTFDGVLAAGTNCDFGEVSTAPHSFMLAAALKKCKTAYSVTQLANGNLVIKSGAFKAIIPALEFVAMATTSIYPDNPIAPIDDRIKDGFALLNPLLVESSQHVVTSTLLLQGYSMMATDRVLLTEFYHGVDLPPGLVLPKAFVNAVAKCPKKLARFGFSPSSVTFWYEDHSWIRSQLHTAEWPNAARIFGQPMTATVEIPKKLKEAVDSCVPFCREGLIYLNQNEVASHLDNADGATYDCKELPGGHIFAVKRLLDVLKFATHVDWLSSDLGACFFGQNIRAMLGKRTA